MKRLAQRVRALGDSSGAPGAAGEAAGGASQIPPPQPCDDPMTTNRVPLRHYRIATLADEAALRALLRENAMGGAIDLCLAREPDYFAATRLFGQSTSVIAETAQGEPVGMYACNGFHSYVDGVPRATLYLHSLRVQPAWRGRVGWLRDGFASIPRLVPQFADAACCFTSIASENRLARRMLEAGVAGMPRYQPQGEMVTLLMRTHRRAPRGLLRPARADDVDALLAFHQRCARRWQFAPHLARAWLLALSPAQGLALDDFWLYEENGALRFCAALWDQRHCRQTMVRGYRGALGALRPLYNAWARARRRVALPAAGARIEHLFLAFAAFDAFDPSDEHAALVLDCIDELLAHAARKNACSAALGLSAAHPLLPCIARRFRAETYRTSIQTVSWPPFATSGADVVSTRPEPSPQSARRPVQPEIALL